MADFSPEAMDALADRIAERLADRVAVKVLEVLGGKPRVDLAPEFAAIAKLLKDPSGRQKGRKALWNFIEKQGASCP